MTLANQRPTGPMRLAGDIRLARPKSHWSTGGDGCPVSMFRSLDELVLLRLHGDE